MKILVTGAAGFIGFHTIQALAEEGYQIIGIDNLNDYYDPALKQGRLEILNKIHGFSFIKMDLSDRVAMADLFQKHDDIEAIIHLGAQAGVRYSIENPFAYVDSNLIGQMTILEGARGLMEKGKFKHLVYASSSSVYGANTKIPFSIEDITKTPVSLYAATKGSGELLAQSYSHLYRIPATGLRFFTVYGPWGRPDMAYFSFTKAIIEGKPIRVFNHGDMKRDFTWYADIVAGILAVLKAVPHPDEPYTLASAPHRVFNLGNHKAEQLLDFIETIENAIGKTTEKIMEPMAAGDVKETYSDIKASQEVFGFDPKTPISEGIPIFVEWYKHYYKVN